MTFRIKSLALLTGLAIASALASTAASAQKMTAQQACQGDAMRLCSAFIPNQGRVRSCMVRQMSSLSPGCRAFFHGGGKSHHRSSRYHRRHS